MITSMRLVGGMYYIACTTPLCRLICVLGGGERPERGNMSSVAGLRASFINYMTFYIDLQPPPPHINPWKTVGL